MADMRIQAVERMVGANHPTLSDTLNRLALVGHNPDGTHKSSIGSISISDFDSLNIAVSTIGVAVTTLVIDSPTLLISNLVVPSTLRIEIVPGGFINLRGFTLTFNGEFIAGTNSCFTTDASVKFNPGKTPVVRPQWWGAIANDTSLDQTMAFYRATQASDTNVCVVVPQGQYRVNLTGTYAVAKKGLVLIFEGNTVASWNVSSCLRPYDITKPVITFGDDLNLTGMTIKGLNVHSETFTGSGIHGSVGVVFTGGLYEANFDDTIVTGYFTTYYHKFQCGNYAPCSKIFLNGYKLVVGNGATPTAAMPFYPSVAPDPGSPYGAWMSAIYFNNFTINGCSTDNPTILFDSAGATFMNGYMDLFGKNDISLVQSNIANGMARLVLINVNLDKSNNAAYGIVIKNRMQYQSGLTIKNAYASQMIISVNSTLSGNGQVDDHGTILTGYDLTDVHIFPRLNYPIVENYLSFNEQNGSKEDIRQYRSADTLYIQNNTGNTRIINPNGITTIPDHYFETVGIATSTRNSKLQINNNNAMTGISFTGVGSNDATIDVGDPVSVVDTYHVKITSLGTTSGSTLIANGHFDTDVLGWTANANATLTHTSNGAKMALAVLGQTPYFYQKITTVPGQTYLATGTLVTPTAVSGNTFFFAKDGDPAGTTLISASPGRSAGTYTFGFTAISTSTYIVISGSDAWPAGAFCEVDTFDCYISTADKIQYAIGAGAYGGEQEIIGKTILGIANGVNIKFNSAVGHTLGDIWDITTGVLPAMTVYSDAGTTKQFSIPSSISTYATNAAAIAGGLTVGDIYKTATGQVMIVY